MRWRAFALFSFVMACAYQPPAFTVKHVEKRGKIDRNGLRFVIMPDGGAQLAEVAVRYDVGASDDPDGKAGLAHLVEHLMFDLRPQGDGARPVMWYLDQLSTSWNAYTTYDSTHYMSLADASRIDGLLQIEALRLHDGCASITEPEFEREREVVRNEIRQRTGTPEGQMEPLLAASLYPAHHPYARIVGGDDVQIASLTLRDACDFIAKYYIPERATLIVAGQIDVPTTVTMIQKWFGGLDRKAPGPHRHVDPVVPSTARGEFALDIERPVVAISWPLPATRGVEAEMVAEEVHDRLANVIGSSHVYEFGLRVGMLDNGGRAAPEVTLMIELASLDKLDEALDFAWKAARSYRSAWEQQTMSRPEHVKSREKAGFMTELEPLTSRANRVADLIQFTPDLDFMTPKPYVFHWLDAIDRVDLEKIYDEAKVILDPAKARITVFKPSHDGIKGDTRATFAFEDTTHEFSKADIDPGEADHPVELPHRTSAIDAAIRFQLDNGMRVVLLPVESSLPIVTTQLIFDAGEASAPDSPYLPQALARFAAAPPEIRRKAWRAGVQVGCRSTPDHTICTSQAMSIYLQEMIDGLEQKFKEPEFDLKSIDRWQREATDAAKRRRQIARDELDRQALAAMFGADHPYTRGGVRPAGTELAIDRDKLFAYRDRNFTAANATLVVAGTFDRKEAESLIRDSFGNWPRGHARPDPAVAPAHATSTFVGIVRDAGPQLELTIEYPSPAGIGGQQAARLVIAEMMSITASDVRQKLGASYGVYARRDERRSSSRYVIRGSLDAPRAGEALASLRAGIDALRKGDDFATTFALARRKVVRRLLDESAASFDLATRLGTIARFDLPANYYTTLIQQVAHLTPAQTRKLIETELAESGEAVIASADRPTLEATFAAAGIKDYKVIEPAYPH